MNVATTIREQIGGGALFMIGAKNLIAHPDALSFKVGRNAKKVTHIKVTLDPTDTYTVEFIRVWGSKVTTLKTVPMVFADQLRTAIESGTGMYTSL